MNPLLLVLASWCAAGLFLVGGWVFRSVTDKPRRDYGGLLRDNQKLRYRLEHAEAEVRRLQARSVVRPAFRHSMVWLNRSMVAVFFVGFGSLILLPDLAAVLVTVVAALGLTELGVRADARANDAFLVREADRLRERQAS